MKLKYIIVSSIAMALMGQGLFANAAEPVETVKTEVAQEVKAPVVGGSVVGISVATISATGYRASKLIGSKIYNEKGDAIGVIDDFIVGGKKKISFAIISVGGFLGMGDRLVAIPAQLFQGNKEQQVILPKASKEDLESLPAFVYAE